MRKKFVVAVLSLVLCFAIVGVVAGCSGNSYDDSDLKSQIKELQDELTAIKGGDSDSVIKVYKLGETATYYNNSMAMFSIKYVSKVTTTTGGSFTFTNINLPGGVALNSIFAVKLMSSTNDNNGRASTINSTIITSKSTNIDFASIGLVSSDITNGYDRIHFYSTTAFVTYIIFEI